MAHHGELEWQRHRDGLVQDDLNKILGSQGEQEEKYLQPSSPGYTCMLVKSGQQEHTTLPRRHVTHGNSTVKRGRPLLGVSFQGALRERLP